MSGVQNWSTLNKMKPLIRIVSERRCLTFKNCSTTSHGQSSLIQFSLESCINCNKRVLEKKNVLAKLSSLKYYIMSCNTHSSIL